MADIHRPFMGYDREESSPVYRIKTTFFDSASKSAQTTLGKIIPAA